MNDRSQYIGGSDVAAIMGISPWRTAWDVWAEKTADPSWKPQEETPQMRWGTLLEPILSSEYTRLTGHEVTPQVVIPHHKYPYLRGTLDGLIQSGGILEAKTAHSDRDWQNGIPEYYQTQGYFYMEVAGEGFVDFAVLFPRGDFRIIRLDADEDIQRGIVAACVAFWEGHVVPKVPPPMDASDAAKRWLARMPDDDEDVLEAGADLEEVIEKLAGVRAAIKKLEPAETLLENQAKLLIGEHQKVVGRGWHATYRRTKPFPQTDWKTAAGEMAAMLQLAGMADSAASAVAGATKMVENRRPFVLKREDEEA